MLVQLVKKFGRNGFLVWLLVIALAPLLITFFLVNSLATSALKSQFFDKLALIADKKVIDIEREIDDSKNIGLLLSKDPLIQNALEQASKNEKNKESSETTIQIETEEFFKNLMNLYKYSNFYLFNDKGAPIFTYDSSDHNKEVTNTPEIQELLKLVKTLQEVQISGLVYDQKNIKPQLYIAVPVVRKGLFLGSLILQMGTEFIESSIQDVSGLGSSGESLVGSVSNNVIQPAVNLRHVDIIEFAAESKNLDKSFQNAFVDATSGVKASKIMIDYRNKEVFAVTRYIPSMGWGLLVKVDSNELMAPVKQLRNSMFILGAVTTLAIFALAYFISERLQKAHDKLLQLLSELEKAKTDVENANKAKSQFLSSMSHELRTPLNAVIGYSEMIAEELEEQGSKEFLPDLAKINTSGKHLLSLVNNILDISKIEAGKMELVLSNINVKDLLTDIQAMATPLAAKKNNRFTITIEPNIGHMYTDATKLRQCLLNLISNACKFTENGTVTVQVEHFEKENKPWLKFNVIDTGMGITQENLDRLFKAFVQVTSTHNVGGTGLGLFLSLEFCQLMGGDITVSSVVNKGSTFTITLPVICEDLSKPAKKGEQLREIVITGKSEEALKQGTVLIIDDNRDFHTSIDEIIKKDYRVIHTYDGKDGIAMAKLYQPDVILLDVTMHKMDGLEVIKILRKDESLRLIPIIITTGMSEKDIALSLGVSDVLIKPIQPAELMQSLKKYTKEASTDISPVVLIVDDSQETRDYLARILRKEGWRICEAVNGLEAIHFLENNEPSLILLDLLMPEMDGFEVVAKLKSHKQWSAIPVVVITSKDLTKEEREKLSGGVGLVIQKGSLAKSDLLTILQQQVSETKKKALTAEEAGKSQVQAAVISPEILAEDLKRPIPKENQEIILIIEPDQSIQEDLKNAMEESGHYILGALNAKEGFRMMEKYRPDLVILDVALPDMDGWQLLYQIKMNEFLEATPVVMLTDQDSVQTGYTRGIVDYLVKPVTAHKLTSHVQRQLGAKKEGYILVVDDDDNLRELFAAILKKHGWSVKEAANGKEALEMIQQEIPTLMLCDIMMPEINGFELFERVQFHPDWNQIPIIIVTAASLSEDELKRLHYSSFRVCRKGPDWKKFLLEQVNSIIE